MSNLRHPSVVVPFELVKLLFKGSGIGNCVIVDSHYRGWGVTGTWEKCEKNVKLPLSGNWVAIGVGPAQPIDIIE